MSHAGVSKALARSALQPVSVHGRVKVFDAPQALRLLLVGEDALDAAQERAKLDAAKREMLELQIREKKRELVPAADVDHGYIALATAVSGRIQSIPSSLALELSSETNPSKCQEILKKAIHGALSDLANAGARAVARVAAEEAAEERALREAT